MLTRKTRTQRRVSAVLCVAVLIAALVLVLTQRPARWPSAPYDHVGLGEVSVATEDIVGGQAGRVAAGLRARGMWCVQARSNDRAIQVACRPPGTSADVDLVADTTGHVLYADVTISPQSQPGMSVRHLERILDDSFYELWPQDRDVVEGLIQDAQSTSSFLPLGREAAPDADDQFSTHEASTPNVRWSLSAFYTGELLGLRIRAPRLRDHSWPLGSDHYATSTTTAKDSLRRAGFTCATSCYRASDRLAVRFDEHRNQIVAAHVTLSSSASRKGITEASGRWGRDNVPFLRPGVRAVIVQRIAQYRVADRRWRGVLAGTPVQIRSVAGDSHLNGSPATDIEVSVGIPLLGVE